MNTNGGIMKLLSYALVSLLVCVSMQEKSFAMESQDKNQQQNQEDHFVENQDGKENIEQNIVEVKNEPEEEDLGICIICRLNFDEESEDGSVIKLVCDPARPLITHNFHIECLKSWLEQQLNCPTCLTPLSDKMLRKIYGAFKLFISRRSGQIRRISDQVISFIHNHSANLLTACSVVGAFTARQGVNNAVEGIQAAAKGIQAAATGIQAAVTGVRNSQEAVRFIREACPLIFNNENICVMDKRFEGNYLSINEGLCGKNEEDWRQIAERLSQSAEDFQRAGEDFQRDGEHFQKALYFFSVVRVIIPFVIVLAIFFDLQKNGTETRQIYKITASLSLLCLLNALFICLEVYNAQ